MVGRWFGILVGALTAIAWAGTAAAQGDFPNRPIRVVLPYAPGTVVDVFGRIVAQNMAPQLNNATILFESRSGANGSIATDDVARSTPDGYTWLIAAPYFTSSPALYKDLRWDPQRDFIPIGEICRAPNVFIVPASLPVKNVAEFVALAKSKPGVLTYGHPGKGSTAHLGFELFKRSAGIDVTGVGYRGYPQMIPDISSGQLSSSFFSVNLALSMIQTGAIRVIATINESRTRYFPDAPTLAEQGYADAQVSPWFGIVVPKGTPQPIVEKISKALEASLASSDTKDKLEKAGCEARSAPLSAFGDLIRDDVALWARVVKEAGITAE